jgi:hypothetical protein
VKEDIAAQVADALRAAGAVRVIIAKVRANRRMIQEQVSKPTGEQTNQPSAS